VLNVPSSLNFQLWAGVILILAIDYRENTIIDYRDHAHMEGWSHFRRGSLPGAIGHRRAAVVAASGLKRPTGIAS
jgi:hypothetical protein